MKEFRSRRLRVWENISRTMQEFKVLLLGYRSYTALLTQTGTDAPVATVLENTLGVDITYQYSTNGVYFINASNNIFDNNKFTLIQGAGNSSTLISLWAYTNSLSQIVLETYFLGNIGDPTYNGLAMTDGLMQNQFIEIRVYN